MLLTYNLFNFFKANTDLVNMVLLLEHSPNRVKVGTYFNKKAVVVTTFLHNLPLKADDIANLLWLTKNVTPWGGSITVVQNYINTLGTKGMPFLKRSWLKPKKLDKFFPIFPTMPTPNRSSLGNQKEDYYRKLPKNLNKKQMYVPKFDPRTKINTKADLLVLANNEFYQGRGRWQFALHRQIVEKNFTKLYKI